MLRNSLIMGKWENLSPRFAPTELFSPDTQDAFHLLDLTFVRVLNEFVQKYFPNRACYVNHAEHKLRGLRSPREQIELQKTNHNAAELSMHVCGKAADLTVEGLTPNEVALKAIEFDFHGIGIYPSFVHLDLRTLTLPEKIIFRRT